MPLCGARPAVLLVSEDLPEGGEADQYIDQLGHYARTEQSTDEIPSERDEKPIEAAYHEQDESDHMNHLHIFRK